MDAGTPRPGSTRLAFVCHAARYFASVLTAILTTICFALPANATVTAVNIQAPALNAQNVVNVASPVHFEATAESSYAITGFVVYVDHENVYQNHSPSLDAWIALPPATTHTVYVTAWDSNNSLLSTSTYSINVTAAASPVAPPAAFRKLHVDGGTWTVDNDPGVGGDCNSGSIGVYNHSFDPNTANSPDSKGVGQHFVVTSKC
jgi:hypothetical protein